MTYYQFMTATLPSWNGEFHNNSLIFVRDHHSPISRWNYILSLKYARQSPLTEDPLWAAC